MIDGNDVEVLEVELKGVAVTSVYKPPGNAFQMHTLRTSKPQVAIGDFNNQIINWGFSTASIPNRRRFNLKKVNWKGFSDKFEYRLQHVQATLDNYDRFSETARTTARHNIPRGCCTNCIPGLTTSARQMYFT